MDWFILPVCGFSEVGGCHLMVSCPAMQLSMLAQVM